MESSECLVEGVAYLQILLRWWSFDFALCDFVEITFVDSVSYIFLLYDSSAWFIRR
jgi:hypothetical protein